MKGKVNLKTIIIFAILILVLVLLVLGLNVAKTFISGATADYEPQNLVAAAKEDGKTATVSWTTDKEVKASVFYGTNMASLLLMAEDVDPTTNHNILLTNLRSNSKYFYKIVVDDSNIFDNGGALYNFETGGNTEVQEVPEKTLNPQVTIQPVVTMAPAASSSTTSGSTVCDKATDYNKDGIVNALDYISCLRGNKTNTTTPLTTVTPGVTPVATSAATDKCAGDYNKDGVVNTLDRLKCLQDSKR